MPQSPFAYAEPVDHAGVMPSLVLFADRLHILSQLREDAVNAGFHITAARSIASLLDGEAQALGEVVLVDCPVPDGAALAALTRLDMRSAQSGAQLIVSTTLDGLDGVFGCLDQSGAQVLIDPRRTDLVLALSRARALSSPTRVQELDEADRMTLIRLTEQVSQLAQQLERFGGAEDRGTRVESPLIGFAAQNPGETALLQKAPLPDARMLRRILRQRQMRSRYFAGDIFADPAWDMLLDLTAARVEGKQVSVTSLCIASCVPPTTAMRWIGQMIEAGLFRRVEDLSDRRRAFIELTDQSADAMARYFEACEPGPTGPL